MAPQKNRASPGPEGKRLGGGEGGQLGEAWWLGGEDHFRVGIERLPSAYWTVCYIGTWMKIAPISTWFTKPSIWIIESTEHRSLKSLCVWINVRRPLGWSFFRPKHAEPRPLRQAFTRRKPAKDHAESTRFDLADLSHWRYIKNTLVDWLIILININESMVILILTIVITGLLRTIIAWPTSTMGRESGLLFMAHGCPRWQGGS